MPNQGSCEAKSTMSPPDTLPMARAIRQRVGCQIECLWVPRQFGISWLDVRLLLGCCLFFLLEVQGYPSSRCLFRNSATSYSEQCFNSASCEVKLLAAKAGSHLVSFLPSSIPSIPLLPRCDGACRTSKCPRKFPNSSQSKEPTRFAQETLPILVGNPPQGSPRQRQQKIIARKGAFLLALCGLGDLVLSHLHLNPPMLSHE